MRATNVRMSAWRVTVARTVLVLAFAGLGARAAHLSVFDQRGAQRGDAQSLRTLTLAPDRGQIVDRDGAGLAMSVDAPSVFAIGRDVDDLVGAARGLARILGLDRATLISRLRDRPGFQFLARWVSPSQAEAVTALELRGVGVVLEPRRIYPHRRLAASVIGFANIDGRGARGIEQQEDSWLRGTTRRLPVERDGGGKILVRSGATTWGTAGGDVALTLDSVLQADAERALGEAVTATEARGGLIVSFDPHTGEILTLAESPSFDPNRFRATPYRETRSTAFLDAFEPGSALKAFLIAAALDRGAIDPEETIDTEGGSLRLPGKTIRDHRDYGPLDPAGVLRVSSNVGAVKVAQALGRSDHFEMLREFGFGASTRSRFPDESAGVLRPWRDWRPVDHATIAFGQGIGVTPIQLAAATATLANGGLWVRPRLVAARRAPGGDWQPTRAEAVRRVLRRETARSVVGMLETVVGDGGTGRRAALGGVRVAGKTGTAQKWDATEGTYSRDRYRAWFVGIVPADAPQLVIVVELDEPQRPGHTGGAVAAPLFARVAASQLAHLGIFVGPESPATLVAEAEPEPRPRREVAPRPPNAPQPASKPAPRTVAAASAPITTPPHVSAKPLAAEPPPAARPTPPTAVDAYRDRVLLPDFRGLSVTEVTEVTAGIGLRVTLTGRGIAVRQFPPPGSVMAAGSDSVHVEFTPKTPLRDETATRVGSGRRG